MNKLIKLSEKHYIVVDDSEIKKGDYKWHHIKGVIKATINGAYTNEFKITHSNQPLEYTNEDHLHWDKIKKISLPEVEEAVNGYDLVTLSKKATKNQNFANGLHEETVAQIYYRRGFKTHQELVKDKLLLLIKELEDKAKSFIPGYEATIFYKQKEIIQSLLPPTEWDIEFVDGKIKLI